VHEFPCDRPVTVGVRIGAGSVEIVAEERATATVEISPYDQSDISREAAEHARVEMRQDRLVVEVPDASVGFLFRRGPRVRMEIRVPLDCSLDVRMASADLSGHGRYADVTLKSASGDAYLEHVTGRLIANTASGDVRLVRGDGPVQFNGASGDLSAQTIGGELVAHSASGDLEVEDVHDSANVTTASGDVRFGVVRGGKLMLRSASGDVSIGIPAGTGVWMDITTMSGTTRSDLSAPDPTRHTTRADLTLQIRTMSGDIDLRRVEAAAA
jgi:DUF4097 and DUF4098 domain-containing protein YvlB